MLVEEILPLGAEQYLIRSVGLLRTVEDIENIVLKEDDGVPIFIRNIAEVKIGTEVRQGAVLKGGYTESASGIVMMMRGGNAKEIVGRVKEKIAKINSLKLLPDGLQITPYYDRTNLVDSALWTVTKVLIEGVLLVIFILFIFLGDARSSLIVVVTLIITPLLTFIVMNQQGLSANLMSLGGLAIAIGLMVDSTVVVVENVYRRLCHPTVSNESNLRIHTIIDAVSEVGMPVIFGVFRHYSCFFTTNDITGYGRENIQSIGIYDCDCTGNFFIPLINTFAGSMLLFPKRWSY